MGKWHGKVGYIIQEEVEPGTWLPTAIEKQYYGDTLSTVSRWNQSGNVNSDLNITNKVFSDARTHSNKMIFKKMKTYTKAKTKYIKKSQMDNRTSFKK